MTGERGEGEEEGRLREDKKGPLHEGTRREEEVLWKPPLLQAGRGNLATSSREPNARVKTIPPFFLHPVALRVHHIVLPDSRWPNTPPQLLFMYDST